MRTSRHPYGRDFRIDRNGPPGLTRHMSALGG